MKRIMPDRQPQVFSEPVQVRRFHEYNLSSLVFQRKTRGVLVLANEQPKRIDEDLKDFLFMVSEYLNQFLENLFSEKQACGSTHCLAESNPVKTNPVLINDKLTASCMRPDLYVVG